MKQIIQSMKDEIIDSTCDFIRIPSVFSYSKNSKKPFGSEIAKALEYILNLGKKLGFRTKNIDGYCGYIECGKGEELIGIIGHIDVVPASDDWTYPPFSGIIENNNIYGRGAIDDKGPVIASLYAMKAIMDTIDLNKRIRLILGTDEERTWKCINYYKSTQQEIPNISFSPDADFPCIYAEKSLLSVYLKQDYINCEDSISIQAINDNENAINVVPKLCSVTLKIDENRIDKEDFLSALSSIIDKREYSIEIYQDNDSLIKLISTGKSAHAAHPDLGVNSISKLLVVLYEIFNKYNVHVDLIDKFYTYIQDDYYGKNLKINVTDESGALTLNVAKFYIENNSLVIGINLRIPVTISTDYIKNIFTDTFDDIDIYFDGEKPSLFISKDNSLVKLLCNIFNKQSGLQSSPIAIGGATYARAFPNCISFGPNLPGCKDMCHQADEFITIDNLLFCALTYAEALKQLCNN